MEEALTASRDHSCIEHGPPPGTLQANLVQLLPGKPEAQGHEDCVERELPLEADQVHFQWDHKQNGIQVIKDGQDLRLSKEPGLFEARGLGV